MVKRNKKKRAQKQKIYSPLHDETRKSDRDDDYIADISLPPIREDMEWRKMREDSAPHVGGLNQVNQWKRRYARTLNEIENQRLVGVHKSIELAQSIMEEKIAQQSLKMKRLMEGIENQRQYNKGKTHIMNEPWPGTNKRKERVSKHQSNTMVSNSCPSFSFSSCDEMEPLGRWVRYPIPPRQLPSLENKSKEKKD